LKHIIGVVLLLNVLLFVLHDYDESFVLTA